jgi:prepilin-type N-terminal cleavage/methylation domain-containing protein/prepilin-type processing-associated H-X9-DG protein
MRLIICDHRKQSRNQGKQHKKEEGRMKRSTRGFTLLELVVVISIITILAGILFPVLAQARETARGITCLSRLKQLSLAHRLYIQDYDEILPCWYAPGPYGSLALWTDYLRDYYRHPALLEERFSHPDGQRPAGWTADYALCAWGPGGDGTVERPYWRWPGALTSAREGFRPMREAEVLRTHEVLQFADGVTRKAGGTVASEIAWRRHRGGVLNGAFVDGHVGSIKEQQWARVDRDERGYFKPISAADR